MRAYTHPHLCSSVPHTPLSSGAVKCVQGKERKEGKKQTNTTLWSSRTSWGTLKMAASGVRGLFSPAKASPGWYDCLILSAAFISDCYGHSMKNKECCRRSRLFIRCYRWPDFVSSREMSESVLMCVWCNARFDLCPNLTKKPRLDEYFLQRSQFKVRSRPPWCCCSTKPTGDKTADGLKNIDVRDPRLPASEAE